MPFLKNKIGNENVKSDKSESHYQAGQYQTAMEKFRQLTAEYPDFLEGHLSLMSAMAMNRDYSGILTELSTLT